MQLARIGQSVNKCTQHFEKFESFASISSVPLAPIRAPIIVFIWSLCFCVAPSGALQNTNKYRPSLVVHSTHKHMYIHIYIILNTQNFVNNTDQIAHGKYSSEAQRLKLGQTQRRTMENGCRVLGERNSGGVSGGSFVFCEDFAAEKWRLQP